MTMLLYTGSALAALLLAAPLPPAARLGGDGAVVARGADAFSRPVANATKAHRHSFVIGNALFKENWVASPASVKSRQGLGPTFNAQSCSTCHFKDGRGRPPEKADESFSSMLVRLSVPGVGVHGGPKDVPGYGDQLQHRANVGTKSEGDVFVRYEDVTGTYDDGTTYTLRKPTYEFKGLSHGDMPADLLISPRVAPAVIGLGLLEAIDEKALLANADPDDKNGDDISGRPNHAWDVAAGKARLGRFGWKANQPSVAQQNAGAFLGDMGITSRHFPRAGEPQEISDADMLHMTTYVKLLAVPVRRDHEDPVVMRGEAAFRAARCQSCHVESFETGLDPGFPENSHQRIFPYTDLLLHDMGESLADGRPDFEADGREWRTPPLWGVGLSAEVNRHTRFLHDGRARNLEEAILWHGGEAAQAKAAFTKLPKAERDALVKFLESL